MESGTREKPPVHLPMGKDTLDLFKEKMDQFEKDIETSIDHSRSRRRMYYVYQLQGAAIIGSSLCSFAVMIVKVNRIISREKFGVSLSVYFAGQSERCQRLHLWQGVEVIFWRSTDP